MDVQLDPDAALMLQVREGNVQAFEQLVEKYKQPVYHLVARTLNDPSEAEDIAQNVFLQVYKSAHRYEITAKFSTWLYTIARNLCLNEIRRRSRHRTEALETPSPDGESTFEPRQIVDARTPEPQHMSLREELFSKVNEAIAALPEKQRTALLLCREEDVSYEEIARVLGCSLQATKSLIHRARETLKEQLKPYLKTGEWNLQE